MMLAKKETYSKAFLSERYKALQHYRSTTLLNPANAEDRRHEIHLRTLIDVGDFDSATKYVDDMILFCDSSLDIHAADLYREYKRRIIEIRDRDVEVVEVEAVAGFYDLPG
jgi:hypothetical protein